MRTYLDCLPCFMRQALEAVRLVSDDASVHERILRDVLRWTAEMDLSQPPPAMAKLIHRRLREITGIEDLYLEAKQRQNRLAMELLPELEAEVASGPDPLAGAVRMAIAGNVIDMGVNGNGTEPDVHRSVRQSLTEPFNGDLDGFRQAVGEARKILYLADNAGEIVFDRLLIERLPTERITLVVRGAPVINDATIVDARAVGLHELVEVIDNGSDAPGTILEDCSPEFRRRFEEADVVLSKGQGNYETLSDEAGSIFFLFKVKCPVVAAHSGLELGTQVLARGGGGAA